ncbi:MAG: hypothetical protein QW589_03975 [Candidatus Bathyarchaeia archaeon]
MRSHDRVCVDEDSMPLSVENDSKRFNELLEGLDKAPKIRY